MRLHIQGKENLVTVDFGTWLCDILKLKIITEINKHKLLVWDEYLTTSNKISRVYDRNYKATEIILFAANNLVCNGVDGDISIYFDNTKFVPGFDRLRLNTAVKLIDYGTLDIKGCPIFRESFDYVENNIHMYVRLYYKF